jgi:gentisate 1,2-dioxygenase
MRAAASEGVRRPLPRISTVSNEANTSAELQRYNEQMRGRNLLPYWEVIRQIGPSKPPQKSKPVSWNYQRDIRPYLIQAANLISEEDAARRVLVLNNPQLPLGCVTHTLCGALQIILPGEVANPHRHTQAAFRLILEGDGAHTIVDGERVKMQFGDLVLTPSWRWHSHGNETDHTVIWFDGLDQPLVGYFGANFHENGTKASMPNQPPAQNLTARYGSGILPLAGIPTSLSSPVLSYPYERTRAALETLRMTEEWDPAHALKMKHANPLSGDYVMPTIATFVQLIPKGFRSVLYRSTESSVQVVLEGRGRTKIEGEIFEWGPRDIVTVPNWCWTEMQADEDSIVFSYSDRAALEKLGLWREERSQKS